MRARITAPVAAARVVFRAAGLLAAASLALLAVLPDAGAAVRHRTHAAPLLHMPEAALEPVGFDELDGWAQDDHAAAFATFLASCGPILRGRDSVRPPRPMFTALRAVCRQARRLKTPVGESRARHFFETEFRPVRISAVDSAAGFLTGYYEPEVEGALEPSAEFTAPLYRRPRDLVVRPAPRGSPPSNKGQAFRRDGKRLVPYFDRAAIEDGALKGRRLEICWLRDPVDAFFAQIQGSVRVKLPDGRLLRLNYDGHNGQPYTPVGRILVDRGIVPREQMSMDAIRAYIAANPDAGRALMRENRSYVFFRVVGSLDVRDGAVGAQGLPLTPERSLAVDKALHVYGTPFYIEAALPIDGEDPTTLYRRLMIAQDTGSAIVGPARGDLFFGAGLAAGAVAGRIRHPGLFTMLVPRAIDPSRRAVPLPPLPPSSASEVATAVPLPPARPASAPPEKGARGGTAAGAVSR